MATHPDSPPPDRIEPQAPPETPYPPTDPVPEKPDEVFPTSPDVAEPGIGPDEVPPGQVSRGLS